MKIEPMLHSKNIHKGKANKTLSLYFTPPCTERVCTKLFVLALETNML